jgi:hypothetical protein
VPQDIFNFVLELHRETKSARIEAVAKKDARLNDKAHAQILNSFTNIPQELIPDILNHTLKKRSGRVGRTATIPFQQSIDLAVRAFIRHKLTDYDELLRDGMSRKSAREKIRTKAEKVVEGWKGCRGEKMPQQKSKAPRPTRTKTPSRNNAVVSNDAKKVVEIEVIDLTSD